MMASCSSNNELNGASRCQQQTDALEESEKIDSFRTTKCCTSRNRGCLRRLTEVLKRCSLFVTMLGVFGSVLAQHPTDQTTSCDELFESDKERHGEIHTPGFPMPYAGHLNCRFKFRAKKGEVVWVEWDEFHLREPMRKNNQCLYDYVEIIVTDYQDRQHVSGRFCGNRMPPKLKTMQPTVDIVFHSEAQLHYVGFKAKFSFHDEKKVGAPDSIYSTSLPESQQAQCGGIATGKHSGVIVSPGYPNTYPADVECNWLIRVQRGKQVYVKLTDLQLKTAYECSDVALYIIDGYRHTNILSSQKKETTHSKSAGQVHFCGNLQYYQSDGQKQGRDTQIGYMSDQNRMIIKFISKRQPHETDYNEDKMVGFRLIWTEVSITESADQCDQFMCSGGEYCIDEGGKVCAPGKQYCIHKSLVCDGMSNCADNDDSDEENCFAMQIVLAGVLVVGFLLFVIIAVICCQRRRNHYQLERMKRRQFSHGGRQNAGNSRHAHTAQLTNATNTQLPNQTAAIRNANEGRFTQVIDHSPTKAPHMNASDVIPIAAYHHHHSRHVDDSLVSPPRRMVTGGADQPLLELKAMPANYHGYSGANAHHIRHRQATIESDTDEEHRPFLSKQPMSNHVPVSKPNSDATDVTQSTTPQSVGHRRKPLRIAVPPAPPDVQTDEFIEAHAKPARVWEQKFMPVDVARNNEEQRRSASVQPPGVTVRHRQFATNLPNNTSIDRTEQFATPPPQFVEVHHRHGPDCVTVDDDLRLHESISNVVSRPRPLPRGTPVTTAFAKPAFARGDSRDTPPPPYQPSPRAQQQQQQQSIPQQQQKPVGPGVTVTPIPRQLSTHSENSPQQQLSGAGSKKKQVGFADSVEEHSTREEDLSAASTDGQRSGARSSTDQMGSNKHTPPEPPPKPGSHASPFRHQHKSAVV